MRCGELEFDILLTGRLWWCRAVWYAFGPNAMPNRSPLSRSSRRSRHSARPAFWPQSSRRIGRSRRAESDCLSTEWPFVLRLPRPPLDGNGQLVWVEFIDKRKLASAQIVGFCWYFAIFSRIVMMIMILVLIMDINLYNDEMRLLFWFCSSLQVYKLTGSIYSIDLISSSASAGEKWNEFCVSSRNT